MATTIAHSLKPKRKKTQGKKAAAAKKAPAGAKAAAAKKAPAGAKIAVAKKAPAGAKAAAKRGASSAGKAAPSSSSEFSGFPKDFMAFFRDIAKNNDREWFAANKDRYKTSVEAPLLAFIRAMDVPLGRFADCFQAVAKTNGGSMFRIYRDTRFSRDKTPYKENAGCYFRHEAGKDAHAPGFYVHLEPKDVFFGGGLWQPAGPELRMVREAISADPERWISVTRSAGFRRRFGEVRGDALKRPPAGFDADDPMIEEIKRTSFFALQQGTPAMIHSKDFVREVAKAFEAMGPFMRFLTDAVGVGYHREV